MKYNIVRNGEDANLTAFIAGEMLTANSDHPNWVAIVEGLAKGDESVAELFNIEKSIMTRFQRVTERVTVSSGRVFFDGEEVNSTLTQQILRAMDEGADFTALANFYEKVATNPNEHSREQLYRWLDTHDFTITPDGDIVGYKGVRRDGNGGYKSSNSGSAIVDGVLHNGQIPNAVGSIIEMPRSEVQHDPSVGCHKGLHVGTWSYAKSFAEVTLEVHVNPRDVVSVPTDCHDAKMRCCRYTVVGVVDKPYSDAVLRDDESEDDEEVCEFCYEEDCDGFC